jgi:hypothetical protein
VKRGEHEKSAKIFLLALQKCPASPKGAANEHRFAYKRKAQRSANNISCFLYSAISIGTTSLVPLHLFSRTRL